jgi:iron(III) transport system permease protein
MLLLCAILLPVIAPPAVSLFQLACDPAAWEVWREGDRVTRLLRETALLTGGVLLLAIPLGACTAFFLYRSDVPGRPFLLFWVVFALLIPLPLLTSGWQTVLGSGGWLEIPWWNTGGLREWTPWGQGLGAAIWIHALAGMPWVVVIVGQGFAWVEPELEEDALLRMPAWRVFWMVTLPRAKLSVAAAGLWLALQVGSEITVTDMMQVRTFAEEIYTQSAVISPTMAYPLAGVSALALPQTVLLAILVLWAVHRWDRALPPRESVASGARLFQLGKARWVVALLLGGPILLFTSAPLVSLVWRAGRADPSGTWSLHALEQSLDLALLTSGGQLWTAGVIAVVSAAQITIVALVLIWLASTSGRLRLVILAALVWTWATPGPLVGLGLKECIQGLLILPEPVGRWLYFGPSPAPLMWSNLVRFVPCAVVFLWPVYRLIPGELLDLARLERRTWFDSWRRAILPLMQGALLSTACLAALLCLGEVSSGKVVSTAGVPGFAEMIFTQMHYGVTGALAGQCLLLLGVVLPGAVLFRFLALGSISRREGHR